jgi:hypothetical protein
LVFSARINDDIYACPAQEGSGLSMWTLVEKFKFKFKKLLTAVEGWE